MKRSASLLAWVVGTLVVCTGMALVGFAQAPQQPRVLQKPERPFVLRAVVELVLVDVVVTDKRGHIVKGLRKEQFTLREDGVPQELEVFDFEDLETVAATMPPGPSPRPPAPPREQVLTGLERPVAAYPGRRLIALLFDLTSLGLADLVRAREAAEDFFTNTMTPADMVAVFALGGQLRLLQDFTSDRKLLAETLEKLRLTEEGDLGETTAASEQAEASGEEVASEDLGFGYLAEDAEFNIFNTDRKLSAIESVADWLAGIRGRKSLVHFSSGITQTGMDNRSQLRATIDTANRANVSIYAVDARGLMALPPGGDASAARRGRGILTGRSLAQQFDRVSAGRETLASLALDTGGRLLSDYGDLSRIFTQVQEDTAGYYLLGYKSSNKRRDGRFRRIEVKVAVPGVRVRHRPGYFAPKDYAEFTQEDRERHLEEALRSEFAFTDLPLALETNFFKISDDQYFVSLSAKLPGSILSFLSKGRWQETEFDFIAQARKPDGVTVGALRDTIRVKLANASFERVSAGAIVYHGGLVLAPGDYWLKFLVRENHTGHIGTFEMPLVIPQLEERSLQVSSVVLSSQVEKVAAPGKGAARQLKEAEVEHLRKMRRRKANIPADPLVFQNMRVIPSVTRLFQPGQTLYAYFQVYDLPVGEEGNPLASAVALVFKQGAQVLETPLVTATDFTVAQRKQVTFLLRVPLGELTRGMYQLQVNILDHVGETVYIVRLPFAVGTGPLAKRVQGLAAREGEEGHASPHPS